MSAFQKIQDEFDKVLIDLVLIFKQNFFYKNDCFRQIKEVSQMAFSTIQQNCFVL